MVLDVFGWFCNLLKGTFFLLFFLSWFFFFVVFFC